MKRIETKGELIIVQGVQFSDTHHMWHVGRLHGWLAGWITLRDGVTYSSHAFTDPTRLGEPNVGRKVCDFDELHVPTTAGSMFAVHCPEAKKR